MLAKVALSLFLKASHNFRTSASIGADPACVFDGCLSCAVAALRNDANNTATATNVRFISFSWTNHNEPGNAVKRIRPSLLRQRLHLNRQNRRQITYDRRP